jgi:uncharacterized membrane protein YvlD (DUF360 family)
LVLVILTLPINILSLGLFTFVINAALMMALAVIGGLEYMDLRKRQKAGCSTRKPDI